MKTVVVGVDGSVRADGALEFALEEAALRGASLRIVCAWEIPPSVAVGGVYRRRPSRPSLKKPRP